MSRFLLSLAVALGLGLGPVSAGYHNIDVNDVADFDILPGWRTDGGTHMTALRVRLAPGWKTYWRAPGEGGIPPRFDWEQSQNLSAVRFHWPTPDVFDQNGMRSFGYEDELILPIELSPHRRGEGIEMRADLEIGVCYDICIPVNVRIAADLDGAGRSDARIHTAIAAGPASAREGRVARVACQMEPIKDGLRITARIDMPQMGPREVAVFEVSDQSIWIDEARTTRSGGTITAVTEMVPPSGRPFALSRSDVRITLLSNGRAVEINGCTG